MGKGSETVGGNETVGYDNLGIPLSFHRPSSRSAQFGDSTSASASRCLTSASVSHPLPQPQPQSPPRQYRSTGTQCPSACDVDCSPVHLRQSRLCRALFPPSLSVVRVGGPVLPCGSSASLDAEPALYGDPVRTHTTRMYPRATTSVSLRRYGPHPLRGRYLVDPQWSFVPALLREPVPRRQADKGKTGLEVVPRCKTARPIGPEQDAAGITACSAAPGRCLVWHPTNSMTSFETKPTC